MSFEPNVVIGVYVSLRDLAQKLKERYPDFASEPPSEDSEDFLEDDLDDYYNDHIAALMNGPLVDSSLYVTYNNDNPDKDKCFIVGVDISQKGERPTLTIEDLAAEFVNATRQLCNFGLAGKAQLIVRQEV